MDSIEALESVRATLTERKRAGAVDFFIGGDLNIEQKLDIADDEHPGLDSIEWYGMYGPECNYWCKNCCGNSCCKTSTAP